MIEGEIEGANLGEKHRNYNKLLSNTIEKYKSSDGIDAMQYEESNNDLDNRLQLDIASHFKNVEYILSAFQSNDAFISSRATANSTWLITDDEFKHIINPKYLNEVIYPKMTIKARCKLNLHIRLNMKNKQRADEFFKYHEEYDINAALKWLPSCSLHVIEDAFKKHHGKIGIDLFKRLCKITFSVFELYVKLNENNIQRQFINAAIFLLDDYNEKFLDLVENLKRNNIYSHDYRSKAHTDRLLRTSSTRVFNNYNNIYAYFLNDQSLSKYFMCNAQAILRDHFEVSLEIIESNRVFLNDLDKEKNIGKYIINIIIPKASNVVLNKFQHYYSYIDSNDLESFNNSLGLHKIKETLKSQIKGSLKKVICYEHFFREIVGFWNNYISKIELSELISEHIIEKFCVGIGSTGPCTVLQAMLHADKEMLLLYGYFPFERAFEDGKIILRSLTRPEDRCQLFLYLLKSTEDNLDHIRILLKFYLERHVNEANIFKGEFVTTIITTKKYLTFDESTWNILEKLFHSMGIYIESDENNYKYNHLSCCCNAIITYNVLHNKDVPDIVLSKSKFQFSYSDELSAVDNEKIFDFQMKNLLRMIKGDLTCSRASTFYCIKAIVDYCLEHKKSIPSVLHAEYEDFSFESNKKLSFEVNKRILQFKLDTYVNRIKNNSLPSNYSMPYYSALLVLNCFVYGIEVPEELKTINTIKYDLEGLSVEQNKKIFEYKKTFLLKLIQEENEKTPRQISYDNTTWIDMLNLFQKFHKNLEEYPTVLNHIKEALHQRKLTLKLADIPKPFHKHFLKESLLLSNSQDVCIKALKHDPQVLYEFNDKLNDLRSSNKNLSLFWKKIRVYWPDTLRNEWICNYRESIHKTKEHTVVTRGLVYLMQPEQLVGFIKEHKPDTDKVIWGEDDATELSIRQCIAKNMYRARPQPLPNVVLWYSRGDYLQYALPSLISIYYNLNVVESKKQVLQLLDSPVSLLKHGIRIMINKMPWVKSKDILSKIWARSQNKSIRTVILQVIHRSLCDKKNHDESPDIWNLYECLINNLTHEESKDVYLLFGRAYEVVNRKVRGKYCLKGICFLKTLPAQVEYDNIIYELTKLACNLIDTVDPTTVREVIQDHLVTKFCKNEKDIRVFNELVSCYVFSCGTKEQIIRYNDTLRPMLHIAFNNWEKPFFEKRFRDIIDNVALSVQKHILKGFDVPLKVIELMNNDILASPINEEDNYVHLIEWKIFVELVKSLENVNVSLHLSDKSSDDHWDNICGLIMTNFAVRCSTLLKKELVKSQASYPLLLSAFKEILPTIFKEDRIRDTCIAMIDKDTYVYSYIFALDIIKTFPLVQSDIESRCLKHVAVPVRRHCIEKSKSENIVLFTNISHELRNKDYEYQTYDKFKRNRKRRNRIIYFRRF